jgi:hypothetical protein
LGLLKGDSSRARAFLSLRAVAFIC